MLEKLSINTKIERLYNLAKDYVLEAIYPDLRGAVMRYDTKKDFILLRYYLDRKPNESDYKSANKVMTNILSLYTLLFDMPRLETIKVECVHSVIPFHKLNELDNVLFAREIITKETIIASARRALWGQIYPAIRQIAVRYDPKEKLILLRYYLDRPPKEDDYESVRMVMGELVASFDMSNFQTEREVCIYSTAPPNKLDPLDGILYARREYDLEDVS